MSGVVAPGKQCVIAFAKRILRTIESPIIKAVGGKRGVGARPSRAGEGAVATGAGSGGPPAGGSSTATEPGAPVAAAAAGESDTAAEHGAPIAAAGGSDTAAEDEDEGGLDAPTKGGIPIAATGETDAAGGRGEAVAISGAATGGTRPVTPLKCWSTASFSILHRLADVDEQGGGRLGCVVACRGIGTSTAGDGGEAVESDGGISSSRWDGVGVVVVASARWSGLSPVASAEYRFENWRRRGAMSKFTPISLLPSDHNFCPWSLMFRS